MIKKIFLYVVAGFFFQTFDASPKMHHEHKNAPMTASIRQVLEQINSDKYQEIVRAIKSQSTKPISDLFNAQLLQMFAKKLLQQDYIYPQDIEKLQIIVDSMKQYALQLLQNQGQSKQEAVRKDLYVVSHDAMVALDSLIVKQVDDDVLYLRQMLPDIQGSLLNGEVDKKSLVRMLSIISEIIQKHDELFISAYDVVVLSQVAMILYLMSAV